jgi:hypothetical protein
VVIHVIQKIAWTPHRVKAFAVPLPETANNNKTLQSNWCRPKNLENTSLLEWLREYNTSKPQSVKYKRGNTLVGTKVVSVFRDEFFFQDMLLNVPHRNTNMFF